MPNHCRQRKISMPPIMDGYKPFGVPMRRLEHVVLLFEEYESLRLCDYENLTQEEASERMKISRPTFTRIYDKARKTIAKSFVEGKAIFIQGGNYIIDDYWFKCSDCNETMVTSKPVSHCKKCDSKNLIQLKNLN